MSTKIKTWQERCQTHPDHNGIVTHAMIHERMAEEIDDLREEVKRLNRKVGALQRAAAAEREACAQILDANADACKTDSMLRDVLMGNAAAIRARGER